MYYVHVLFTRLLSYLNNSTLNPVMCYHELLKFRVNRISKHIFLSSENHVFFFLLISFLFPKNNIQNIKAIWLECKFQKVQ